jgi:hypothetical protein
VPTVGRDVMADALNSEITMLLTFAYEHSSQPKVFACLGIDCDKFA